MNLLWKLRGSLASRHSWWLMPVWAYATAGLCSIGVAQPSTPDQAASVVNAGNVPDPYSTFQAGVRMFEGEFFHQAGEIFDEWLQFFPEHELHQNVSEYATWARGEHAVSESDYSKAAASFSQLLRDYPQSKHRLDHAFGEAWSRFYLQQYERVAELLTDENAPYTQAVLETETTGDPRATSLRLKGQLLLAETWLKTGQFDRTKGILDSVPDWSLSDELVWRREFLLTQLLLKEGDLVEARQSASRLLAWARSIESVDWIAESVALKGDVLKSNGQLEAALETYQDNLAPSIPEARRREARLKIIELNFLNEENATVLELLSGMLNQSSSDASLDIVLLTLAELHLKQYYQPVKSPEPELSLSLSPGDLLMVARKYIDTLLVDYPVSTYRSRGYYALGWCLWELGEYPLSLDAFTQAAVGLEKSMEHAECLFKQADVQLKLGQANSALTLYKTLLTEYQHYEDVRVQLFEQALYQMLRAAIDAEGLEDAEWAAQRIIHSYPNGPLSQRSRLLLGQRLIHLDQISEARDRFLKLIEQFGEFTLRAEVDLALAHTYEREGAWASALTSYEQWLEKYKDSPDRARAEYALAWVHDRLDHTERALALFQQFVRVHEQHAFVPLAQNWIADYYFNRGLFREAEAAYGKIADAFEQSTEEQKEQSVLMMGKCQFRLRDFTRVIELLTPLSDSLTDKVKAGEEIDRDFGGEVFLSLGDAHFAHARESEVGSQEQTERAGAATNAYIAVYAVHRPNRWEATAWGRSGDLKYYLGEEYQEAIQDYGFALGFDNVSISMRSQLEYSLGQVKERMAEVDAEDQQKQLNEQALQHFLSIVYLKNLKKGENPDAFWVRKAGIKVMEMLERTRNWEQAKAFSEYLIELMPAQKDEWLRMMTQWNKRLPLDISSK